jgi:hypothetical protein
MAKKFYGQDMRGKQWLQRVNGVAAWTAADEGRILYDSNDEQVKYGNSSQWAFAGAYNDVPLNTVLLIESDTALTGYTLLTNKDDMTVYISKGSGAGGEAGASDKSGSTWTQPGHTHTQPTHTHPVASHTHTVASGTIPGVPAHTHGPQAGYANFMSSSGSTHGDAGDSYGTFSNTDSSGGGGSSHNHGGVTGGGTSTATAGGGDATGSGAPANTWRPRGRNFTRQQRT